MARDKKAKTKKRTSKLPASVSALLQYLGGTQATIGAGRVIGKPTEISPIDLLTKIITQQPQYLQQQQQQSFKEDVRKIIEEERQARLLSQQESKKLQERTLSSLEELKTQYEGSVFGKELLMEKLQQAKTEIPQITEEQIITIKPQRGRKSKLQTIEEENIKKQQEQEKKLLEAEMPLYTSSLTETPKSSLQSEGVADIALLIKPEEKRYSITEETPQTLEKSFGITPQYSTPNPILQKTEEKLIEIKATPKLTLETTQEEKIKMYNEQLIRGGLNKEEEKELRKEIRKLKSK